MPGQNRGETWAQSQASTLEESPWVDLGASLPSMGAAIKTTSPAMENHFLLMIFCNEKMSLQPSFPWAAFAAISRKSKARAARLFRARDLSWRDRNCPGATKSGTAGGGNG